MVTPNGQHSQDPADANQRPASTVLALDGWGPLLPEPPANGVADEQPELDAELVIEIAQPANQSWRREPNLDLTLPPASTFRFGPTLLAPAAAIGLVLGVVVGLALRWWQQSQVVRAEPAPAPPSRLATLRRSLALSIDPTLAQPCPPQNWLDQILSLRREDSLP